MPTIPPAGLEGTTARIDPWSRGDGPGHLVRALFGDCTFEALDRMSHAAGLSRAALLGAYERSESPGSKNIILVKSALPTGMVFMDPGLACGAPG